MHTKDKILLFDLNELLQSFTRHCIVIPNKQHQTSTRNILLVRVSYQIQTFSQRMKVGNTSEVHSCSQPKINTSLGNKILCSILHQLQYLYHANHPVNNFSIQLDNTIVFFFPLIHLFFSVWNQYDKNTSPNQIHLTSLILFVADIKPKEAKARLTSTRQPAQYYAKRLVTDNSKTQSYNRVKQQ